MTRAKTKYGDVSKFVFSCHNCEMEFESEGKEKECPACCDSGNFEINTLEQAAKIREKRLRRGDE